MTSLCAIARDFLNGGGKRLRPRLCRAVFAACGGAADDARLAALEEAVECFHKASLVHDDIQDGDEIRYGRPTVWKEHGVAVAIAVGDWLVAHGYEKIMTSGYPNVATMLAETVQSHRTLCEGQGEELLRAATKSAPAVSSSAAQAAYVSICARKTGEAFALAAQLGALAAGRSSAPWHDYGIAFGVLFQIRDDRADQTADPALDLAALERTHLARLLALPETARLGEWFAQK